MRKIYALFALACVLAGCVTDDQPVVREKISSETDETQPVEAIVINEGDPETDGCGWTLTIDSTRYKPTNLSAEFKVTDLRVKVTYEELETIYRCGLAAFPMPEVKILSIEKD